MKTLKNNSGFTLIELILVIAILGILAVAVAPQFVDMTARAKEAAADGTAGSVRDGINMQYADSVVNGAAAWLTSLDSDATGECSAINCFSEVLQTPITAGWSKTGANVYQHVNSSTSTYTYTYDPTDGSFER